MKALVVMVSIIGYVSCLFAGLVAAQRGEASPQSSNLKDYVSCQFSDEDEMRWRANNSRLYAIQSALVQKANEAISAPGVGKDQMKQLKNFRKSTEMAASRVQVEAAVNAVTDSTLRGQLEETISNVDKTPPLSIITLTPPGDVLCSQSILSFREASDTFGKRIAGTYLVVQVVVRNLNQNSDFLLHDVLVAAPTSHFRAGHDKLLARGVGIKGQSLDTRNMIMAGLDTLSATAGAISLLSVSTTSDAFQDFQSGNNVLTAFIPPLKRWFPDYTIDQLNRLSDLGFSASSAYKVVVPKGGSVPFVTFVPQEFFFDSVKNWTPAQYLSVDNNMYVLVAGVHIQEVQNTTPSLTQMQCPKSSDGSLDLSKADKGNFVCTLTGQNLNQVQKVRLKTSDSTDLVRADGEVKVTNQNSTEANATFQVSDLQQLVAPSYDVYLVLSKGDELHTNVSISLANPAALTVLPADLDLSQCASGKCNLQVAGLHLDSVSKLGLSAKDNDTTNLVQQCDLTASSQTSGSCDLQASQLKTGTVYFVVLITKSIGNIPTHKQVKVK